jgi:hypothetical protein
VGRNGFLESCQFLPVETDSLSAGAARGNSRTAEKLLKRQYSNVRDEGDKIVPFFLIPLTGLTDEVGIADDIVSKL